MSHSLTGHLAADILAAFHNSLHYACGQGKGKKGKPPTSETGSGKFSDPTSSSGSYGGRNGTR